MSKFLKVMIVLLTIVAVAAPVMAEDRLGLAGQMRVRGWHIDDGGDSTTTYADQRLRIGGKLSIAEGVSVTFRTDITESTWGDSSDLAVGQDNGFGSGRSGAFQQWDRAHLDLASGNLHFRAGQQYLAFGNNGFDAQDNGVTLNIKGMIPVTVFYMMDDNNGASSDAFWYGARVAHKGEAYASQLFVVGQNDATVGEDVIEIGLTLDLDLDPVKLYGEAEFFTGDASDTADATGTQLYVSADMAASEMVNVGAQLFYAAGNDDASDQNYNILGNDFGGWDPLFALGTGLDNEQIGLGRPFGLFGQAGVVAAQINASVKATDSLTVAASVGMAQAEDDKVVDDNGNIDDDVTIAALGLSYAVMANTQLGVQVEYVDFDSNTDEILNVGTGLFVNF